MDKPQKGAGFDARTQGGSQWLGVVLAGGKSSRMGKDKRILEFAGEPFLARAMRLIGEVLGPEKILVSGNVPNCPRAVKDFLPGLGPVGGLYSILKTTRSREAKWILLLPVDMPGLTAEILKNLKEAAESQHDLNNAGFIFEGQELPAVLRISPALRNLVSSLCRPGIPARERSLRKIWKTVGMGSIQLPPAQKSGFQNINTPEQWKEFQGGSGEHSL